MQAAPTEPTPAEDNLIGGAGFESAAVPPPNRFEAWRESMAASHDIAPAPDGAGELRIWSRGWALADLVVSDLAFSPISYCRRPGKSGESLLLRLYQEGEAYGLFDEASFRTRPGEIHLFDQLPECRGVTTDWHRLQSVFIPYAAVGYDPGRHPGHLRVGADSAVGRFLRSAIETLFAELPRTRQAEAATLAAGFAGLVKGLLLAGTPSAASSREFGATRRVVMRRYLVDHLDDPELGMASLCRAFAASRATIYRDFADEGGVARYVTRLRLERAFRDLAGAPPDRGRVRRVAERWGFASPYHFSRAFHREFDLRPSEVFEAGRTAGGFAPLAGTAAAGPPGAGAEIGGRAGA